MGKARQAWKPQRAGGAPASQNATPAPQTLEQKPVDVTPQQPAGSIPVEVSPVIADSSNTVPQESILSAKPKVEEKPRVGVLLPGNFSGEDMSFQFGNLGLSFGDSELGGRVQEDIKSSGSSLVNDASRVPSSLGAGPNGDMQRFHPKVVELLELLCQHCLKLLYTRREIGH